MSEPEFVSQTSDPDSCATPRQWFSEMGAEASVESGCTFFRFSLLPAPMAGKAAAKEKPKITALLIEGWVNRPIDQGDPRWQLNNGEQK